MMNKYEHYMRLFRNGDEEEAFFGLIEPGLDVLPDLSAGFYATDDSEERAFLLKVLRNIGGVLSVSIMEDALSDKTPDVWKEALDGLVSLASPQALNVLYLAQSNKYHDGVFREWLEEAIEQIETTQKN